MATKRKVNNLLALAVLSVMMERPMHRYEIAQTLREHGKDRDMAIKWGSLYTVVQSLEKVGFLEIVGSERDGARPERVIYRITDPGRTELADWTRELIAEPEPEQHRFVAGLSVLSVLPPDEVIELLSQRIDALYRTIDFVRDELDKVAAMKLPRLFTVETEYGLAMLKAEAEWSRSLRDELVDGTFEALDWWRQVHVGGFEPAEAIATVKEAMAEQQQQH